MLLLVSYDIVDDKQRTKLAKRLQNYGQRVQYSVFECDL
ncbi:CRISPR-associated endonuclease Cas2, partial [candidate division KSB1 bacterium]|nr:CRISPR-associated endonuclease Cas2 [candidate division KSB1 bacterium]MCA9744533.1 CRISPR-associated endonuclease Cas2 [candidate division KSB1 bacterium]